MPDVMMFPDTVEEFMESYKVTDVEHVYSNGVEFVPIYRMRQWFQHQPECKKGKWIDMGDFEQCSVCTGTHLKTVNTVYGKAIWIKSAYCPNCGADMGGENDG